MIYRSLCFLLSAALGLSFTAPEAFAQIEAEGFEFQVNSYTTGRQTRARVARLRDGRFVVVYDSNHQDGDEEGVYARLYELGGAGPVDDEFLVNSYTTNSQIHAAVAPTSDGGFLVAWESVDQTGPSVNNDIYARFFDDDGEPTSDEFMVNQETVAEQTLPNLAVRGDGDFVVSWASRLQDGDDNGVYARLFGADGIALTDEFQVNTYTTNDQTPGRAGASTVAWYNEDEFVVTWQSDRQDELENSVQARRFDDEGTPLSGEFQISQITEGNQASPAVASTGDNTFIVTWNDRRSDGETYLRRYDSSGTALGDGEPVGEASTVSKPSIDIEDAGDTFSIVWTDADSGGGGIIGRRFDAFGLPITSRLIVNTYQTSTQQDPDVIVGPGNEFVVVWESNGQDFSDRGIFGQRLSGQGLCGDAILDEVIRASDALVVLKTAVKLEECSLCICDVNGGGIRASDALDVLRKAVGTDITLTCPAC